MATGKRKLLQKPLLVTFSQHASNVVYRQRLGRSPVLEYINPAVSQMLGYMPEELYSFPAVWESLTHVSDQSRIRDLINDKQRQNALMQTRWRHRNGHFVLVEQELVVERAASGRATAIEAVVRLLPDSTAGFDSRRDSPNVSMLELLSSTTLNLSSALDIRDVMERILREVGKIVPNDGASIMLIDGEYARIVCHSGTHERSDLLSERLNDPIPLVDLVYADTMITSRHGVVVPDVSKEPRWLAINGTEWVCAYAAVPIVVAGKVIGLLNLDSRIAGAFQDEDVRRLEIFAKYAAIAIGSIERYETEHFERLVAEGLQRTTEIMVQSASKEEVFSSLLLCLNTLIKSEWSAMLLMRSELLVAATTEGTIATAIREGTSFEYAKVPLFLDALNAAEPVTFGNIRRMFEVETLPDLGFDPHSWIGIPIIVWDVIVGYLAAASTAVNAFSERETRAARAFAHQAALVIEHAEILSELEVSKLNLDLVRAQLLHTARLHMAGEIATGIAHKVNNPLTTVIAESYLLAASVPDDSPQQESIRAIRDAAFEAGTVVQRLMDTARLRPLVLRPTQVNDSIAAAVSMIRGQIEPNIARLVVDLADNLPLINGSADHLRDLWLRLLLNARDAIDHRNGGKIIVKSVYQSADHHIQVSISDNGKGIAAEQLDNVFKPLYTTKEHATGLGLAICNEIVSNHHGVIRVASASRKGTIIHVSFSAAPQSPPTTIDTAD